MGIAGLSHRIIQPRIHRVHFTALLCLKIWITKRFFEKDHANLYKIKTVLSAMKEIALSSEYIMGVCLPSYKGQIRLPWGSNGLTWDMKEE